MHPAQTAPSKFLNPSACYPRKVGSSPLFLFDTVRPLALVRAIAMLSTYGLRVHPRPPDGACFYWSAGTGLGTYTVRDFDLLGHGTSDDSPLDYPNLQQSARL